MDKEEEESMTEDKPQRQALPTDSGGKPLTMPPPLIKARTVRPPQLPWILTPQQIARDLLAQRDHPPAHCEAATLRYQSRGVYQIA